jgi:TRAP-type C4-dicarboxylate transport system permease small subunit
MRLGGSELLVIVLFLIPTVWAIFDILQTKTEAWTAARQDQAVWVLVVLLLPGVGALLFFLIARPRLRQAR